MKNRVINKRDNSRKLDTFVLFFFDVSGDPQLVETLQKFSFFCFFFFMPKIMLIFYIQENKKFFNMRRFSLNPQKQRVC